MSRTYVPQVAGIYTSNREGFTHFLISQSNPVEWWSGDALPCDKYGKPTKGYEYPITCTASDFGDCIYLLGTEAGEY